MDHKPKWWEAWNAKTTLGRPTNRLAQGAAMAVIGLGLLAGLQWVKVQQGQFVDRLIDQGRFPMSMMVNSKWNEFCVFDQTAPKTGSRWVPDQEHWTLEFMRVRNDEEQRRWTRVERARLDVACGFEPGESLVDQCHAMGRPLAIEARGDKLCLKAVLTQ